MYPAALGSFMVQQVLSGVGLFNGTEFGRAKAQIPTGSPPDPNAVVFIASKMYGTLANALSVSLIDRGAGITVPATQIIQTGSVIEVFLQRDATLGLQARAVDVVNAINAYQSFTFPVRARYGGTGLGVMAATSSPVGLSSLKVGEDSVLGPSDAGRFSNIFKWTRPSGQHGGFFYFEQTEDIIIRQLEFNFTVSSTQQLKVQRVNLDDGLEPISAEKIPFFEAEITPAEPQIAVSDVRVLLHPYQAVLVECPAAGTARLDVSRAGSYYLP
jgi:hypothetical protein